MRRANDRAHVPRVLHPMEVHEEVAPRLGPSLFVDADDPGARPERRDRVEELGLDVLARTQDEFRAGPLQVLALGREPPELRPPALLLELPDRLELVVVG